MEPDDGSLTDAQLYATLWEEGDLRFLMHEGQLRLVDQFEAWRRVPQVEKTHDVGALPLVFAVKGGKRFGKTSAALWLAHMIAVWFAKTYGRPIAMRYTSAWQKTIDEIIGTVSPQCFETAPPSCEPKYFGKRGILPAGFYWPEQGPTLGARLALAGLDVHKDALRGQGNDFDFVSEAAFVGKLDYTIRNVLIHQYQQREEWARMMVETSAPEVLGTDWEMIILPDAERRGACFEATIEDNTRLTRKQKDFWINQAGGRGAPNCEREYFNVIAASPEQQVVPEFDSPTPQKPITRHVREAERPPYAIALSSLDPGMRDLFGILWGYWDAARAKLVIERDWVKRNAGTSMVAEVIRRIENELYGDASELLGEEAWYLIKTHKNAPEYVERDGLLVPKPQIFDASQFMLKRRGFGLRKPKGMSWWDGKEFRGNPLYRVSDTDSRLIGDLNLEHQIAVMKTAKDDKEAALFAVRDAIKDDKIEINPRCVDLISHVRTARWNENRTDYERTDKHGHYDLLDCLVYLWRITQTIRKQNPSPPAYIDKNDPNVLFVTPPQQVSHDVLKLREVFGGKRKSWR